MTRLQLTAKDHTFLQYLLHATKSDPLFHQLLQRKLDMACVVRPDMLDPRTATIGSTITFRVGGGSAEDRVLTRHENMAGDFLAVPLPVTTLRGLAMLGLKAGDLFALRTPSGVIEPLRLEAVRLSDARRQPELALHGPEDDDDPGPRAA